jgi:hypothetical protein
LLKNDPKDRVSNCSLEDVCREGIKDGESVKHYVISPDEKVRNLITDFDLVCANKFAIGLIGSMYFLGESFGSLLYTFFITSNQRTRLKHVIFKNVALTCSMNCLVFLFRDIYFLYGCVFTIGFCKAIAMIQGFPFLTEALPLNWRNLIGVFLGIIDKMLLLVCTFYFKNEGQDWL